MSDFSDRQFHVGSLVGLRAFSVDSLGRLVGPTQGGIFTPGVNEAVCKTDPYTTALAAQLVTLEARMYGLSQIEAGRRGRKRRQGELSSAAVAPVEAVKPKHTLAGLGCKCGYYAYFDGMNDYMHTGRIAAVVEGFGVYTIGTRGFRTSKARLVALIKPPMGQSAYDYGFAALTFGGNRAPATKDSMTPLLWSYVQRNYPDVPVFETQDEALSENPLYQPETPTPETADDFWTRSAR